jgi:hypothetical protein
MIFILVPFFSWMVVPISLWVLFSQPFVDGLIWNLVETFMSIFSFSPYSSFFLAPPLTPPSPSPPPSPQKLKFFLIFFQKTTILHNGTRYVWNTRDERCTEHKRRMESTMKWSGPCDTDPLPTILLPRRLSHFSFMKGQSRNLHLSVKKRRINIS